MTKTIYINLFGASGAGKSTTAAKVFANLKDLGYNVELVREYVKEHVWQGGNPVALGQFFVCAEQFRREWALDGKVDFVVTDSPWRLAPMYAEVYPDGTSWDKHFTKAYDEITKHRVEINVFVTRSKPYNPAGRVQTAAESNALAARFHKMLEEDGIDLLEVESNDADIITDAARELLYKLEET